MVQDGGGGISEDKTGNRPAECAKAKSKTGGEVQFLQCEGSRPMESGAGQSKNGKKYGTLQKTVQTAPE